jgi:hypothetical protein
MSSRRLLFDGAAIEIGLIPIEAPAPSGSSGQIKYWNGSAWIAKPVKVWNGSAWVVKPVKFYNGSIFVTTGY